MKRARTSSNIHAATSGVNRSALPKRAMHSAIALGCARAQLRNTAAPIAPPDTPESDLRLAKEAGFTVVDLTGVFGDEYWKKTLWITEWDGHPNQRGHRMIANRLYELLRRDQVIPVASGARTP